MMKGLHTENMSLSIK